jgi:hypothetical protein
MLHQQENEDAERETVTGEHNEAKHCASDHFKLPLFRSFVRLRHERQ